MAVQAQDKNQVREQAKASLAQLRAVGEPKDRCATGAELQDGNMVSRAYPGSSLAAGDKLLSLSGVDVAGKTAAEAIGILRATAPDATIPATVSRSGTTRPIQITCVNSRPVMEAYVLGLDQAASGKFDDCLATFSRPVNLGFGGAAMKAQCAALARKPDDRTVGEANFDAMRFAVEDATYVPSSRPNVARQLRAMESSITQSVGAARFQQLVAITRTWPGDEQIFAKSEPDWALFRRNGEQSLRGRLIDPDSARIEWPRGFTYGTWKPLLSKRIEGYWTCGLVNARNRMGGYTGSTAFVVVLDNAGNTLFADMGSGRDYDILSSQCGNSAKMLPPAPAALAGTVDAATVSPVSIGDELKKLVDLKASGALSEAEFQAAKQRLLGTPKP
ncbi:MAG TPA: SHOCT domain-containing protein [Sphingomonas sp.]